MQQKNILKCHLAFAHLLDEEDIRQCDYISITDDGDVEQMIYLFKTEDGYEVHVHKANPQDTFVPHKLDFQIKKYEANDELAIFFFDRFFFARRFVSTLGKLHPEYKIRPVAKK